MLTASIDQQVQLHSTTSQYEQTGMTEVDRQGCWKEKCREALCSRLLLLSLLVVVPSSGWTCLEWCGGLSISVGMLIKFILKSVASLRSMTPGDSVSVVKLNPQQQLSHASYTTDSWSADRQPAQIRQDQRPAATVDQHLLLHHTYVPRRADRWDRGG